MLDCEMSHQMTRERDSELETPIARNEKYLVWDKHEKEIMEYHLKKLERLKKMHELTALRYKSKQLKLLGFSLILGGISSVYSYAGLSDDNIEKKDLQIKAYILGTTMGIASIINGLQHNLAYNALAAKHIEVANEYNQLIQTIDWNIDIPNISARELSKTIQKRLKEIIQAHKDVIIPQDIKKEFEQIEIEEKQKLYKWQQAELLLMQQRRHSTHTYNIPPSVTYSDTYGIDMEGIQLAPKKRGESRDSLTISI